MRAADYPASLFGIKSDGITLNTHSIQFAIDYINRQGGGRLVFSVGKYLTGSVHLKSDVTLQLEEGAMITGSLNPLDYDKKTFTALIFADSVQNISITGTGIIDGQGSQVASNLVALIHSGIIKDPLHNDRPTESIRPMLIYFRSCKNVLIKNIMLRNSASWVETYDQCQEVLLESIRVDSKCYWNNDGVDIVDCDSFTVRNCYIDAADDGICLKSHDGSKQCRHILIQNNKIRSSANGVKFGTASYGGFVHVHILNNYVFDTYRSALALEAVDGGSLDDVIVDSLRADHIGNGIFLRIGERVSGKKSSLHDIRINHLMINIAAGKPDSGYAHEGPIEDQPRNISPAIIIAGLAGALISDVDLKNITIRFPGGGNPLFAKSSLDEIEKIPERPSAYPEFSMFKELPAWGIYIRHAQNINAESIHLICEKKDYRIAVVLDDVHQSIFKSTDVKPGVRKIFFMRNSSELRTK